MTKFWKFSQRLSEVFFLKIGLNGILDKVRLENDWNSKPNDFLVLLRPSCSALLRHANEIKILCPSHYTFKQDSL